MNGMLFLLVRIDPAGAKLSESWMWADDFLAGNSQGHVE